MLQGKWRLCNMQKGPYTLLSFMKSSGRSVSSLSLALMITSPSVACNGTMRLNSHSFQRPANWTVSVTACRRVLERS